MRVEKRTEKRKTEKKKIERKKKNCRFREDVDRLRFPRGHSLTFLSRSAREGATGRSGNFSVFSRSDFRGWGGGVVGALFCQSLANRVTSSSFSSRPTISSAYARNQARTEEPFPHTLAPTLGPKRT